MTEHADTPEHVPGQLTFTVDSDPFAVLATRALNGEPGASEELHRVVEASLTAQRLRAVDQVEAAAAAADTADADLDQAVRGARAVAATWEQIGRAAGMTRQSAWRRWHVPGEAEQ